MESGRRSCFLLWAFFAALLSQNVVLPVLCCDHPTTPCPTPSHGGGGSYGKPPSRGGGGAYGKPPSRGSGGGHKAPPSHGGGGYYAPPTTPSRGSGGGSTTNPPTVPTPVTPTPTIPLVPVPPTAPVVFPPDPHPITGTCDFWRTHPALIWGIIGYWGTIGGLFGFPIAPIFGSDPTILQALGCPRMDGYGALLREGAASFLNSMANNRFPYTTKQVKESFTSSLVSERTAASQAQRFKLANEGRLKI